MLTSEQRRLLTLDERRAAWLPILAGDHPDSFAWIAEDARPAGRVVGIALAHLDDRARSPDPVVGVVHSIHVEPELHGRGLGRRLLDAALDDLRVAACSEATLTVLTGNSRARAFYEHLGWSPDGPPFLEAMSGVASLPPVEVVRYRLAL